MDAAKAYRNAQTRVFMTVRNSGGMKLSELSKSDRKIAERLVDQGRLTATALKNDWLVN